MNIFLFEVELLKFNTDEVFETVHVLAYSLFQASHIVIDTLQDGESMYSDIPLEIGSIRKIREIKKILNPAFVLDMMDEEEGSENEELRDGKYTGDIPLTIAKNLRDEQTISFNCECHEPLRIPAQMGFPFLTCPNCGLEIKPEEIKNAGGLYFYQKSSKH